MADRVHILAVDDEQDIREILRILLESRGYAVACAANGDEAVSYMEQHPETDLVIMDIMMPGLDGIEACAQIREHSSAPILFLTAKTLEDDKAQAYGAGGDDYLGKPFSQAELLMKVESLVRRYRIYRGKPKQVEAPAMKVSKRLVLCEEKGYVIRDGEVIPLTNKEVEILRFFMDRPGRVIDARMLYEGVWRDKYLPSSTNTVMVHILNLRKKLESDYTNPTLIRTVWGKGYQLDEEE